VVVELSVMEQRYQAVMAVVQDGWKVTEVADRLGVARQSVHIDSELSIRPTSKGAGSGAGNRWCGRCVRG
jgi:hypothetical protein